ncbi:hypothetical protein G6514_003918 [Epicoccum nigrum]|nr:hypothetical protein G6514_003918 [Epicoccum nigrum]
MNATEIADLLAILTPTKELKAQITGQARALYSRQHSPGHTFDVIISKKKPDIEYEALLILYPAGAQYGEWTGLLRNPRLCESPVDAMTDLLEEAYVQVGNVVEAGGGRGARGWLARVACVEWRVDVKCL